MLGRTLGEHPQIGGLPLLHQASFNIALGGQVIVAALVVLFPAALAVQVSTLMYAATSPLARFFFQRLPDMSTYATISILLAVGVVGLSVIMRMDRYLLLLLGAMFYPYAMQLAYPATSSDDNLIGHPTPAHLALLFFPPLLVACAALVSAVTPVRVRAAQPSGPDSAS